MPTLTHAPHTAMGRSPLITPLDLAYLIYLYPVRFAARLMPPHVFLGICESLIRLGAVAWRGRRDRAARNLRATFPAATDNEIRGWAAAVVGGSFNRAFQDLVTRRLIAGDHLKHVKVTGLHHLEAARSEGRGVLVFSGHFLAARLARCYLEARGMPMLSTRVGRPSARRASRIGRQLLQPSYVRLLNEVIRNEVFVEEPGSSLRLLRRLREGGIVSALLDTGIRHNLSAPTMPGRPLPRGVGILEVVRLTRAPMVPVAWFGDWRSLTIEFLQPIDLVDTPDRRSFLAANLPRIDATIEELIRRRPDQWEVFGWAWRNRDAFSRS
jgi:Kdo2-lipid IVA lauroyltransferase/acyltransferase